MAPCVVKSGTADCDSADGGALPAVAAGVAVEVGAGVRAAMSAAIGAAACSALCEAGSSAASRAADVAVEAGLGESGDAVRDAEDGSDGACPDSSPDVDDVDVGVQGLRMSDSRSLWCNRGWMTCQRMCMTECWSL